MEIIRNFKKGIIQWLWIIFILLLSWISYAAWTSLSTETDWATITVDKWNAIINRLNSIDQKSLATAWVNFDWTNCTGWAWANECVIKDSYNVNKVIKTTTGEWECYTDINFDTTNYSVAGTFSGWNDSEDFRSYTKSINKFKIFISQSTSPYRVDRNDISVQVFWWKN